MKMKNLDCDVQERRKVVDIDLGEAHNIDGLGRRRFKTVFKEMLIG